ncbi:uncharacterized protein BXZ73DRAFT_39264 [Epithele typhae]|uniref:uncharacterized protein n=1 Tax=Epithele typhae TaxID=378194 RepID=UPI0020085E07|nr:uncharacterized protein BXZ73DRAFT_39264 [Epithele typhae]KAH9944340.1 hypothetical protein BXZ73DRAFT_39264 [Epithele typhae]
MSFIRDLFAPSTSSNVPLTNIIPASDQDYSGISPECPPTVPLLPSRSTPPGQPAPPYDEDEEDLNVLAPRSTHNRSRLYPPSPAETSLSACSSVTNTPTPSRAPSPFASYYSGTSSSDSDSDDDEADSPLLSRNAPSSWRSGEQTRWFLFRPRSRGPGSERVRGRRRWKDIHGGWRSVKRLVRRLVRHPFFPKTPVTILLTLLAFTIFGVSLTFLLIYILNPDKEPLPWRGYCTLPQYDDGPPSMSMNPKAFLHTPIPTNITAPEFPPADFDTLAPAGVFVGVFSMDTSVERRMLVRSTWAKHVRSREGAGVGDGGVGTSRTIVRFILGLPQRDWDRRVRLEADTYKDMVILPISENMNGGKTHAFFSWAANNSWVPPQYYDGFGKVPEGFSYLNETDPAPSLAAHDPKAAFQDQQRHAVPQPWVRPDFVLKADDDSFVMLAELEARLRVDLYKDPLPTPWERSERENTRTKEATPATSAQSALLDYTQLAAYLGSSPPVPQTPPSKDPLVFWGYLVKNRFMAGELYALSFALVRWVAQDPLVKTMTRGAEDKQTSKWIRAHPLADQVRWSSHRCWIYDHPRAGTVYSHGFLFPSEVKRVQDGVVRDLERLAQHETRIETSTVSGYAAALGHSVAAPEQWAHSTVSKFHVHYQPPVADLNLEHSVEALVEGSDMSLIHDDSSFMPDTAWKYREGRNKRYGDRRVGGTVVVHFIKKNMWFLETAAALLRGDDVTELERSLGRLDASQPSEDGIPSDSAVDVVRRHQIP